MPEPAQITAEPVSAAAGNGKAFLDFFARHRFALNLLVHNVLFVLALAVAFLVRFDGGMPGEIAERQWFYVSFLPALPFFLFFKSLIFGWLKLYRGWWQYAGIRDIVNILLSSWLFLMASYAVIIVFVWLPQKLGRVPVFYNLDDFAWWLKAPSYVIGAGFAGHYSQGVLVLDFMATVFLVSTARLGVRLYHEELRPVSQEGVRRVLIVGSGNTAEALLREINRMRVERYRVVGLLDEDPARAGSYIHGIPVLGTTAQIRELAQHHEIDEIIIAMPRASQKEVRRIIDSCQGAKMHFQILPSMDALIEGRVTVSQIRKIEINDLLGRQAVQLDTRAVAGFLSGRRVLVTGAGGSIGSEMCRQICSYGPARLILLEHAENSLFHIANELRKRFPETPLSSVICDIYDRPRVMGVFQQERPQIVIHAAAHKHVPLMELNPCEAIKNNVFGTKNVADAACAHQAEEFVMISTDKAVNPSSLMGCSKRVAEMYTQSLNGRDGCATQFKSVRFGNVLGSAGSVVPTFEQQIRQGGPVTVTHPEMVRYFMTIPEAAQLVLQAAAMGKGGQVFLLDMGEPVKIVDLARDMITLSGLRVGEDIDIVFTGIRPGEKLFEELRTDGEDIEQTVHPKVKVWKQRPADWELIQSALQEMAELTCCGDRDRVVRALQRLVPEYQPMNPPKS